MARAKELRKNGAQALTIESFELLSTVAASNDKQATVDIVFGAPGFRSTHSSASPSFQTISLHHLIQSRFSRLSPARHNAW